MFQLPSHALTFQVYMNKAPVQLSQVNKRRLLRAHFVMFESPCKLQDHCYREHLTIYGDRSPMNPPGRNLPANEIYEVKRWPTNQKHHRYAPMRLFDLQRDKYLSVGQLLPYLHFPLASRLE